MRSQSNELVALAKELRDYIKSLNLPMSKNTEGNPTGINFRVSDNIRAFYNVAHEYTSVEFNPWPKTVVVALFQAGEFSNNTISIPLEKLSDEDLDAIIVLVKSDIAIFMQSKLIKQDAIYTSAPSI